MKLSQAQVRVLTLLASNGPMDTSKTTHHNYVSGICAHTLERMGLVEHQLPGLGRMEWRGFDGYVLDNPVRITEAGRKALSENSTL
jgi:hypothetical protein